MRAKTLGEFLKFKRSQRMPSDLGLAETGHRRVAGLRRDEVAARVAISTDYYLRIEQGRRSASKEVLEAIARVLELTSDERGYVFELSRQNGIVDSPLVENGDNTERIPVGVSQAMTAMPVPSIIHNGRFDILGANGLARALYVDLFERQQLRPNLARFTFLDSFSRDFLPEWVSIADQVVASLRWEAARSPADQDLDDLLAELGTSGDEFTKRWDDQKVSTERPGTKRINHPVVGLMTLNYASMEIQGSNGLFLATYTVDPGSQSEDALKSLELWASNAMTFQGPIYEEVRSTMGRGI